LQRVHGENEEKGRCPDGGLPTAVRMASSSSIIIIIIISMAVPPDPIRPDPIRSLLLGELRLGELLLGELLLGLRRGEDVLYSCFVFVFSFLFYSEKNRIVLTRSIV
jgi:hypothetical protein